MTRMENKRNNQWKHDHIILRGYFKRVMMDFKDVCLECKKKCMCEELIRDKCMYVVEKGMLGRGAP